MATFLDVSGLEHFSNFFAFIFVWLLVYAVLTFTHAFGDNKAISIFVGLLLGIFVLMSPTLTGAIGFIVPWFAAVLIFIVLISVLFKSFGAGSFEAYGSLKWGFLVLIVIAMIAGTLGYIRDRTVLPGDNESATDSDFAKSSLIIFHPKVMGMLFILIIAVFTIALLAGRMS